MDGLCQEIERLVIAARHVERHGVTQQAHAVCWCNTNSDVSPESEFPQRIRDSTGKDNTGDKTKL